MVGLLPVRAVRISLGADRICSGRSSCQHGNDGSDSWGEARADERGRFCSERFDEMEQEKQIEIGRR